MSSGLQWLFRYRKLIDDTLERHQEIIVEHKACWWGWWQRPAEGVHLALWTELARAVETDGHAWVGLFDSDPDGQGNVHRAKVVKVLPPSNSGVPSVPADEQDLVPKYYRTSSFSSAWMKIEEIELQPIDFYKKHAFRLPPEITGVDADVLAKLTSNTIAEPEELWRMDTTMWAIRPSQRSDRKERILIPSEPAKRPKGANPDPVDARHTSDQR